MSTTIKFRRLLCGMACALSLSACMTAPVVLQASKLDELVAQANLVSNAGQKEKALTLLKAAAAAYPADKTPWLQMAQMKYDAGQYGEAIINAQEVLVRDPRDKLANSIVAISGLRLSTRALSDLSSQNNLSASLRIESQDLAKLLRESLGETVRVAPRDNAAARGAARRAAAELAGDDSRAYPFNALK